MPCGGGRSSECCLSTKGAVRRGAVFREQRGCLSATRSRARGRSLGCHSRPLSRLLSRLDLAARSRLEDGAEPAAAGRGGGRGVGGRGRGGVGGGGERGVGGGRVRSLDACLDDCVGGPAARVLSKAGGGRGELGAGLLPCLLRGGGGRLRRRQRRRRRRGGRGGRLLPLELLSGRLRIGRFREGRREGGERARVCLWGGEWFVGLASGVRGG